MERFYKHITQQTPFPFSLEDFSIFGMKTEATVTCMNQGKRRQSKLGMGFPNKRAVQLWNQVFHTKNESPQ